MISYRTKEIYQIEVPSMEITSKTAVVNMSSGETIATFKDPQLAEEYLMMLGLLSSYGSYVMCGMRPSNPEMIRIMDSIMQAATNLHTL